MNFFRQSKQETIDPVPQSRVDAIVAAARAQGPVAIKRPLFREPPQVPWLASRDPLDRSISEELAFARRSLEAMGDALSEDPILMTRHGVQVQTIDLLAQILGHLASVVAAGDRNEAVGRIGMTELRNRLTRHTRPAPAVLHRSAKNPFNAKEARTFVTHSGTSTPAGPVRASAK